MSDFQIGDVVVCVDASPPRKGWITHRLRHGAIYRVTGLPLSPSGKVAVLVDGEPPLRRVSDAATNGWLAGRFKHLPRADEAFTAKIRALKPVKELA